MRVRLFDHVTARDHVEHRREQTQEVRGERWDEQQPADDLRRCALCDCRAREVGERLVGRGEPEADPEEHLVLLHVGEVAVAPDAIAHGGEHCVCDSPRIDAGRQPVGGVSGIFWRQREGYWKLRGALEVKDLTARTEAEEGEVGKSDEEGERWYANPWDEERVEDEHEYRGEDGREHDQQQTLGDFGPG
eukprot:scaffold47066_cov62-Phaeocystis_antarctica.AAC.3